MKFPSLIHVGVILAACCPAASAYLHPHPTALFRRDQHRRPPRRTTTTATRLHYKEQPNSGSDFSFRDDDSSSPSSNGGGGGGGSNGANVWSVLANTERWISDTLDRSNQAELTRQKQQQQQQQKNKKDGGNGKLHFADEKAGGEQQQQQQQHQQQGGKDNPYARKEVSYVCETGAELAGVVGGVFRRVREAREIGEAHGRGVEARLGTPDDDGARRPVTMRSTNVVVIPNCAELSTFQTFDGLVHAINQARRAARDFVVKKDDGGDDGSKDWVVSINCAHLHPQYGMPTPEEQLASLKHEDQEGEVDVNLQEYKKRRDEARRSPYPSVIVEVMSTPPPDFGSRRDEAAMEEASARDAEGGAGRAEDENGVVTSDDVRRLEALFAMSAAKKSTSADDPFYDALGEAFGKKQIISQTPLSMAQSWVLQNDPAFNEQTSTFTKSETRHVDAAYEFFFNNLAMLNAVDVDAVSLLDRPKRGQKSYVVLPNFLPTSATSFDKFAGQVSNIIRVMPSLTDKLTISTFHPEHVVKSTQAPVPIIVITWK